VPLYRAQASHARGAGNAAGRPCAQPRPARNVRPRIQGWRSSGHV